MEKHSLLKDVSAFVEFGAGSALYSVAVYEHVKKPIPFLLVDKLNGIQNKVGSVYFALKFVFW